MNALLSENYFFFTAMDPSAMMYAKAFKWVLEDRPYVGCEFRLSLISLHSNFVCAPAPPSCLTLVCARVCVCVCAHASFVPDSSFTPVSFS